MYNIVELFSGIGSQARALKNLGQEINVAGTCEWDIHAVIAYDLLNNPAEMPPDIADMDKKKLLELLKAYTFSNSGKEALEYNSLKTYSVDALRHLYTALLRNNNHVDINTFSGFSMPENIDILTYSFPCQDLSNVGALHGYNKGIDKGSGSRSSLLWQVGRILSEMRALGKSLPRFLVMENVPALLSKRHFSNFSVWMDDLHKLGYISSYYQLNASDFGLPQNRPRLLMISVYVGDNEAENDLVLQYFRNIDSQRIAEEYRNSDYYHRYSVSDLIRQDYSVPELLEEARECTPNNTVSRQKIWEENPQLVLPGYVVNEQYPVIRTITTKQDRNPNSGNLYFESGLPGRADFRYLTPRECMLFMGFTDNDYVKLKKNNIEFHKGDAIFARDKVIRLAGNSIPVKLLEGIFLQVLNIDSLLSDFRRLKLACVDEVRDRQCKRIRSYLHGHGIRSRLTKGPYPDYADILYPCHRAAIYICDCVLFGHDCCSASFPTNNKAFWENIIESNIEMLEEGKRMCAEMNWKAIVIWTCQLTDGMFDETMQSIEYQIKCIDSAEAAV